MLSYLKNFLCTPVPRLPEAIRQAYERRVTRQRSGTSFAGLLLATLFCAPAMATTFRPTLRQLSVAGGTSGNGARTAMCGTFSVSVFPDVAGQAALIANAVQPIAVQDFPPAQFPSSTPIASCPVGIATASAVRIDLAGNVQGGSCFSFGGPVFDQPGKIFENTLVNGVPFSGSFSHGMRLTFSAPVEAFGCWIYDDEEDTEFRLRVVEVGGATTTGPGLLVPDGFPFNFTGFLGFVSCGGIESIEVLQFDPINGQPIVNPFEMDHLHVSGVAPHGVARYCTSAPSSFGPGALISAVGTTSIGANDFTLVAADAPPANLGLFFYGTSQASIPFGDGTLCISGMVQRLPPALTIGSSGITMRLLDFATAPASSIPPSATRNFQFWYRDPSGSGGSGFNLSDAMSVLFIP